MGRFFIMQAIIKKPDIDFLNVYKNVTDICLPGEIWKDIEKYDVYDHGVYKYTYYFNKGDYQGSNYGRLRSLKFGKIVLLRLMLKNTEYLGVHLRDSIGKDRVFTVHRLVAMLFIPNPDNLPTVNHLIEANKTDNSVFNLEWASYKQQVAHGTCKARSAKKCKRKVAQLSLNGDVLKVFDSACDASMTTGICRTNIMDCCKGRLITAGGYQWKYVNEEERCVLMYSNDGTFLNEFNSIAEASRFVCVSSEAISHCLHGALKTVGGYQWRWKSDCPNYENIDPVVFEKRGRKKKSQYVEREGQFAFAGYFA